MAQPSSLQDFMEGVARRQKIEPPEGYGYKADVDLGVGFFLEARTGVKVLEKPLIVPSGHPHYQGYMIFFAYSSKEGIESIVAHGNTPPKLPATTKEPREFESLASIADNFGAKDTAKAKSEYCLALRVPSELAAKVDVPDRDIWIISFDQDRVVPFLTAAREGDAAKVKKILAEGVSGQTVDEDHISALMMAATVGSVETCAVLIEAGAEVDFTEPRSSRTALMFAAQGGHTDVVDLLIKHSADITKVDSDGTTALMWAAAAGQAGAARALANHGGRDAKNNQGQTALEIAQTMKHEAVIAVLQA